MSSGPTRSRVRPGIGAGLPAPVLILGPSGPIPVLALGDPRAAPAGVLLGYGLGGRMEVQWPEAQRLAAAGYAVIVPEAPHHGLRADGLLDRMARSSGKAARACFLDVVEAWAAEIPVLVDHLAAQGATRFVLAGVSMGGHWALAGPARDPRIEAVASLLGDPAWDDRPGSPHRDLEPWSATALLAIVAEQDAVVPPGPMLAFVDRLKARFPAADRHHGLSYPGGHGMAAEAWEDAWSQVIAWLDRSR